MTGLEMGELILLKSRVTELIKSYRKLEDELEKERSERESLSRELSNKEIEFLDVKKDFERVKLSGAILGGSDETDDAKKRINELVREIDNCIALLNNI